MYLKIALRFKPLSTEIAFICFSCVNYLVLQKSFIIHEFLSTISTFLFWYFVSGFVSFLWAIACSRFPTQFTIPILLSCVSFICSDFSVPMVIFVSIESHNYGILLGTKITGVQFWFGIHLNVVFSWIWRCIHHPLSLDTHWSHLFEIGSTNADLFHTCQLVREVFKLNFPINRPFQTEFKLVYEKNPLWHTLPKCPPPYCSPGGLLGGRPKVLIEVDQKEWEIGKKKNNKKDGWVDNNPDWAWGDMMFSTGPFYFTCLSNCSHKIL